MSETLSVPQAESLKVEAPGLVQTRSMIQRYQTILTPVTDIDTEVIDGLTKKYGLGIKQIVRDTIPSSITQSEVVVRTDTTNILLDQLIKRGKVKAGYDSSDQLIRVMSGEGVEEFTAQTAEERVNQDFAELEEVLQFQKYINQVAEQSASPFAYKELAQKMAYMVDMYKRSALHSIAKRGDELFAEDVLGDSVPTLKQGLGGEDLVLASGLLRPIKMMLIAAEAPNDLRKDYAEAFRSLDEKWGDHLIREYGPFQYYSNSLLGAVGIFTGTRMEGWQNLVISPSQTRKIYDIASPSLIRTLFAGGHESWGGTEAVGMFRTFRDPRVLPYLIDHLRRFGPGHTSNFVAYSIDEILKNPLDQQDLEQVLSGAQPLQKKILNDWFIDPSKAAYKIVQEVFNSPGGGYSVASLIQHAESYLSRGDLSDVALEIAKLQGREINWVALKDFFHNNQYGDMSWVEDTLMQDLDKVAAIIAKSGIADWHESSKRVFNALISPPDGNLSKFSKIIAQEGLGLTGDLLRKLDRLYESGDLRRGVMARAAFAEGLLFLSSKKEGPEIVKNILDASTGANRDSERIRDIFSLLRSLDSFGKFESPQKGTLAEINTDLKSKLVVAVAEKMELEEEDRQILNEKLFDLMRSGVFEIVPHLLARFYEQGKGEVVSVVREVGRHIVLGDFKEWRNSLNTAIAQLSVLPESKRAVWTDSAAEVILTIGISKESDTRKGAVDAIRRIASETRAHILDVYKLDFSASGINILKQKQQELVRSLKSSKDYQERRDLGNSKRGIDDQLKVIEGLLGLESLNAEELDPVQLTRHVEGIINAIASFEGLEQAVNDLTQISGVLITQAEIGSVTKLRAYDSDDPLALLKVGVEPRETCQSYRNGSYNYCLPAYVADANKRVINVENDRGEVLGRSVMKLTQIRDKSGQTHPAILLEPTYTTSEIAPIYRGVVRIALEKAKSIGAYLVLTSDREITTGVNNDHFIPVVEAEAKKGNMQYGQEDVEIYIPRSVNPYEYSDSLGGAISYFDIYHNMQSAVVVKP